MENILTFRHYIKHEFIDFAKAFDTVWRKGLWHKLLGNEINGKMYKVIFNMYSGIKSRVLYNGEMSVIGLKLIGSSLSPLFLYNGIILPDNQSSGIQPLSNIILNSFT
jgi:hypothetical protein